MPFAEDFDAAAAALEKAAHEVAELVTPARAALGGGVMVGGQLTDMVAEQLDAASAILTEVGTELTGLAGQCRERAETCRQALTAQQDYQASYTGYEKALGQWKEGQGAPPEPPQAPERPPAWVNH